MKKIIILNSLLILLLSMSVVKAHQVAVDEHAALVPIPEYAPPTSGASAQASLNALTELMGMFEDPIKASFAFSLNSSERQIWSNLPPSFVKRSGIAIDDMTDPQRKGFFMFLSASLGKVGYEKVAHIIAAEAFLNKGSEATGSNRNPASYWFAVYGEPSMKGDWGWQIDGHHLAMNIAVNNGTTNSMSPSFIGTEPAVFTIHGKKYEAFVDMHESGYAVYNSLTQDQKKQATLQQAPSDVLTGPNKDGFIPPIVGVKGENMSAEQKSLLIKAIEQWVLLQTEENSSKRMKNIENDINETTFALLGNNQPGTETYFRIQGPRLIIELSLKALGSGAAKGSEHYHTMYRNPTLEYGLKSGR